MTVWSDALPNLLIGLREGLEAGLIVAILVAAVVRAERRDRLGQLWAGVACAAGLSLAFGAVLTFAAADLSTAGQEAIGGALSLVAVGFVTWMVFWMRRTARTLSAELRTRTDAALVVGGTVLFVLAFVAVAREGLETALFLWSTTRTANETAGPLIGAVIGLLTAVVLCWALYREALHINLSRFFTWTGGALIVIAAGVLGYGLRELQGAGILPGDTTYAFTTHVDPSAWYSRIIEGVFNLAPTMTVLQVVGYFLYLVPVMTAFVVMTCRANRAAARRDQDVENSTNVADVSPANPAVETPDDGSTIGEATRTPAPRAKRRLLVLGAAALVIALGTIGIIVAVGPKESGAASAIVVTNRACAPNWAAPIAGQRTFEISNTSSKLLEVYLMDANRTTARGEIEGLAPGTSRTLSVGFAPGSYVWRCVTPDGNETFSTPQRATGTATIAATGYAPATIAELDAASQQYRSDVATMLDTLARDTDTLAAAVRQGGPSEPAKTLWLQAHLDYLRLGAAYGTFGDFDTKINGRPNGLPNGVDDPGFTGFLRLERELWQAPPDADPATTAAQLDTDIRALVAAFPTQDTDPRDLPLRAHEILENGLQFELTGITDHGSHTNLANLRADVDATRIVLGAIQTPLSSRKPRVLARVSTELDALAATIDQFQNPDGTWKTLDDLTLTQRQTVNGAVSQMVEHLAPVPDILELPPSAN